MRMTLNVTTRLNYIQIHNLGHFLEKNILWLNLVLVLLLKWSIVLLLLVTIPGNMYGMNLSTFSFAFKIPESTANGWRE